VKLTADQCALYAQVIPVFMLIAGVAAESFARAERTRRSPSWMFVAPIVLGTVATLLALTNSRDGAGAAASWFITYISVACVVLVAVAAVAAILQRSRTASD
jgi:uncharacterized membrane protein HdeD (DUF308 family)